MAMIYQISPNDLFIVDNITVVAVWFVVFVRLLIEAEGKSIFHQLHKQVFDATMIFCLPIEIIHFLHR